MFNEKKSLSNTFSIAAKKLLPLFFIFFIACGQKEKTNPLAQKMDEFLTGQQKYYRFNGNVLVAENGKIVFQKSYGLADFDKQRMLNDSSVFELASVSKQFTATGILLLLDKGKLKLTDSLRQYFPELPYNGITIWHMLTHTSGLPAYEWAMNEKWDKTKIAFNNDLIAFLAKEKIPPMFEPGKKWEYSNTAYALLASIIAKVSGQPFANFMSENIFQPIEMTHTRIYNTRRSLKDTIANYAYGYVYNDSLKKYLLPDSVPDLNIVFYLDGIQGDGVVNSTTADLLKWDRAIKNHTLLKEETQNDMLKGKSIIDTARNYMYGFGVFVEKNDFGNIISHSGGWPGYATYLARNTDKDQTYVILSNNGSPSPGIGVTLQHIMAGKEVVMPSEHKEIKLDSSALDAFTGNYKAPNDIKLERRGESLFRVLPNGSATELKPESANKFFYSDGTDRQIEFELDANKKIIKAWLIAFGVKTELKKQ
ncbi:MAG: beta-lactamase family protein [Chitinophagaceae bacterium]|nr:beta-lactamase family protein [Chitinophagaceae bacterium]